MKIWLQNFQHHGQTYWGGSEVDENDSEQRYLVLNYPTMWKEEQPTSKKVEQEVPVEYQPKEYKRKPKEVKK